MFKKVSISKAMQYMHALRLYNGRTLFNCYATPSHDKKRAYDNCLSRAISHNATLKGVVSYNCQRFSFAFAICDDMGVKYVECDTGVNVYFWERCDK